MSTLVTGGTGFVGSNIVRTLARQWHQAVCFDYTNDSTTIDLRSAVLSGGLLYLDQLTYP